MGMGKAEIQVSCQVVVSVTLCGRFELLSLFGLRLGVDAYVDSRTFIVMVVLQVRPSAGRWNCAWRSSLNSSWRKLLRGH